VERIEKLLGYLRRAFRCLDHRYYDPGTLVPHRSQFVRRWRYHYKLIVSDSFHFFALATVIGTTAVFASAYGFFYRSFGLQPSQYGLLTTLLGVASHKLPGVFMTAAVILLLAGSVAIVKKLLPDSSLNRFVLVFIGVTCVSLLVRPRLWPSIRQLSIGTAWRSAIEDFMNGEFDKAEAKLVRLRDTTDLPPNINETLVESYLPGLYFRQGEYKKSILYACDLLSRMKAVDDTLRRNLITTLHWAIYGLAQDRPFDQAKTFVFETRQKHGVRCALEASPFWLAISPEIWSYLAAYPIDSSYAFVQSFDEFLQLEAERANLTPDLIIRYRRDRERFKALLVEYPHERYADHVLYLLGRYDEVISSYPTSPILHLAYYAKGVTALEQGNYQQAISEFREFIERFPQHQWQYGALDKIAWAYSELGEYRRALGVLLQGVGPTPQMQPSGYLRRQALYIIDVYFTADQLSEIRASGEAKGFEFQIDFSIAEKLFEEERFDEARQIFRELRVASLGTGLMQEEIEKNLLLLDEIRITLQPATPEARLEYAYLIFDSPDLVFYNELWNYGRQWTILGRKTPLEYFERNNDYLQAAQVFEEFANLYPEHPRIEEARFMVAKSYQRALTHGLMPDHESIRHQIHERSIQAYRSYLADYFDVDPKRTDAAMEAIGLIYLAEPRYIYGSLVITYSVEELEQMRQAFLKLIAEHPAHHLVNNMYNWIAWSYCLEANMYPLTSLQYEETYQRALQYYQLTIDTGGPLSLMTRNARQNIETIVRKLENPALRKLVPEALWYWYDVWDEQNPPYWTFEMDQGY